MKTQRFAIALTLLNLVLLTVLVVQNLFAETQSIAPVLRGRSLEIVDAQGRVRALLAVMPPDTVDGKAYPETVLLRLIDPKSGPVVKLTAAENGSALGLSDDAEGGVQVYARDTGSYIKVVNKEGQEKILRP